MKRPRILIITRNLPPLVGGMERLNWHIADELSRYADIRIIAPQGSSKKGPCNTEIIEVPLSPLWHFLLKSGLESLRSARSWKPDLVLGGSGLMAPACIAAAKFAKARAAVYLHGLDAAVQHPAYRAFWHPSIRHMDTVIANSHPTAELAHRIGVQTQKLKIVHPGVTLPEMALPTATLKAFRDRYDLGEARLLLSVGRLTTRKGLLEFVQQSLPLIVRKAPDTLLLVVGDAPTHSLHATIQSREAIQTAADALGIGKHLRFTGMITDPIELASAYEAASLHILPVRQIPGDPEGFGMVAIEAAAHGLPTIAFATGGIVDAVAHGKSGYLVEPGNYVELAAMVLHSLSSKTIDWQASTKKFAQGFKWSALGKKMQEVLLVNNITTVSEETSDT